MHKLKINNLTEDEFQIQLHRQNYSCYGCLKKIDKNSASIDHCRSTGRFRGLLCDQCSWILGFAKDSPATLRRLMAYLDYKREMLSIYLIGALKNEIRIPEIGNILRNDGYDVMDEWITPGEHADENWQRYEKIRGRTYQEALHGRAATNIYLFDKSYIDIFDVAICIMPAGKSAFIELGYAKGRGKKTFILLDGKDPERYDIMPNIADKVCFDIDELKEELKKIKCPAPETNIVQSLSLSKEQITSYELIALVEKNFDAIMEVWAEMIDSGTLKDATIEWAKRNGREIEIISSK